METYSISNPSDPYTLQAPTLKIASMAVVILGGGMYGLWKDGETVLGIPQTEAWLEREFGNWRAWLDEHIDELIEALDTVKLDAEKRTSLNNIGETAKRFARELRARKKARGLGKQAEATTH
jgi:hypothetical protein